MPSESAQASNGHAAYGHAHGGSALSSTGHATVAVAVIVAFASTVVVTRGTVLNGLLIRHISSVGILLLGIVIVVGIVPLALVHGVGITLGIRRLPLLLMLFVLDGERRPVVIVICLAIAVMAGGAGHARLFNASVDEIEHEAFCLVKGFDDARAHLRVSRTILS